MLFVNIFYFSDPAHRPYIGLEHFNKTQKKTRFNYLEKAIKIYN